MQATFGLLLSDGPLSFPTCFPHHKLFPSTKAAPCISSQFILFFFASKAGKIFGIACPFNRYRLYSGFLSVSKITLTCHVACFTTTISLTQYVSSPLDLSRLDTSALSSTRTVSAVSSQSRQFLLLTIVWLPSDDDDKPCMKHMFLSLSNKSGITCLALSLLFNSASSRNSDQSLSKFILFLLFLV